ncbi:uncharacterized protein LOC103715802 [Phoenix dactylifera]|uniref:Uncharacterized protein LOC103715802 n=1 Tax=Phoenix dactylifera TaxID=42345 RepID=A0A8B7CLJ7_PHODC|nr:uncharacterized protein LOC103715802 [Phoenix dactylifera]
MASNEYQGGFSLSMSFRGRPLRRRSQVVSMEHGHEQELHELDLFHSHVADRLLSLLPPDSPKHSLDKPPSPLLSLAFLSKLLDTLLAVEAEFRPLLPLLGCGPPAAASAASRPVADLLDRAVKSLDLCNAVSLSLHSLRHWLRHAQIAASALLSPRLHLLRARRALFKLLPFDATAGIRTEGAGSFGRRETNSRFLSWSMSRNCSAHLAAPRGGDGGAGELAAAVYTMSAVLVFAMWALGAALPCQERGGPPVAPPRQLPWAAAMVALQERIAEEWRRRDRKAAGMLAELLEVERCGKVLIQVVEEASGARAGGGEGGTSLERERAEEVAERAAELAEACRRLEEGLGPLERQVREVFHRVVGSRAEVLRCLDQRARSAIAPCPIVS